MKHSAPLFVTLFGSFSLMRKVDGRTLTVSDQTSTSKKLWPFLQYLIVFRQKEAITQPEVIHTLWYNNEEKNPTNALKTLLHRARNVMEDLAYPDGKQILLYRRGIYGLHPDVTVEVDAEQFESFYQEAKQCAGEEKLSMLLQAIKLYKGEFLPKYSDFTWVMSLRTYYCNLHLNACAQAIELLAQAQRHQDIINLCRKALLLAPYEEELHIALMNAQIATGAQQSAMQHYAYTSSLFMDQLGITPSEEFSSIYQTLIKTNHSVQLDLTVVRSALIEESPSPGPFYCELAIFREIYRWEARIAQRSGTVVQLGLISILDSPVKKLTQKQVSVTMERLESSISSVLRRGDAFTRLSASQYLMLLPYATHEGGEIVLRRVTSHFKRCHPKSTALLHYGVLSLLPFHPDESMETTHFSRSVAETEPT